jgi:erythromycin esterase
MKIFLYLLFFICSISIVFTCNSNASHGELVRYLSQKALPLGEDGDIDELIEIAGSRRLILLGESSHGTAEFYRWRAEITKRLISENNISFIAVEGDWASIYRLNKYIKDAPGSPSSARRVLRQFDRWPEWMWGNTEIENLAEWLREYNSTLPQEEKVGFFGMDVYGQWEAMEDLLEFTVKYMPDHHSEIQKKLQCFASYDRDEWRYARAVVGMGHPSCADGLSGVVELLGENAQVLREKDENKFIRAKQNAIVIKNAEDFFRLAVTDNTASWNSRATHMWESVLRLLNEHGDNSKAVVWAHNTHVGDAEATTMRYQNMVNIGQLSRQFLGKDEVFITGFGTNTGRVNAGSNWGSAMQLMRIPEGIEGSYENILSQISNEQFYLIFDDNDRNHPDLMEFRGHRAIGVVYNPRQEAGNYVPTILPRRYDAFIFIGETSPLKPVR